MRTIFAETSAGHWTRIADLGLGRSDLWNAIDGCRLRYHRGPVKLVCDDPYWALLATYVLGDGDLARNSQVRFYDNEKATLTTIRDMFYEKYGYLFPSPVYEENQYGRGQWIIRTRHAAIHFVLTEYFLIPVGRKKLTSTISERIAGNQNPEVKYAALAGMFSSDGYVSCNRVGGRFSVRVCVLTAVSQRKILRVARLLRKLGYHPYVSTSCFHNPLNGREITAFAVIVHRHAEVVGLFFHLFPYLLKPFRTRQWMRLIANGDFYKRIRLRSPEAHLILREAAMKTAGNSYRYLHVLAAVARENGIKVERWGGVKHWTCDRQGSTIPLAVLVECCRILGKNVLEYVPVEFGTLLWLRGVIDYSALVSLRRVKPLLKLEELRGTRQVTPRAELPPLGTY